LLPLHNRRVETRGWAIEVTDEYSEWYASLTPPAQARVARVLARLEDQGPALGRPLSDTLKAIRTYTIKELRVSFGGHDLRILFAFDPRRTAILLLGGDKTGRWKDWYQRAIPEAERLYARHLDTLRERGWL
jgi:hypothetical protein